MNVRCVTGGLQQRRTYGELEMSILSDFSVVGLAVFSRGGIGAAGAAAVGGGELFALVGSSSPPMRSSAS